MNKDLISSNCIFYNYNDNIIHSILSSNNSNKYISEIVSYNLFLDDKINKINNIKQKITNYNDYFYLFIDYHRILLKVIYEDN